MKRLLFALLTTSAVFAATVAAQEPVEYAVTVYGGIVKGSPHDHFVTLTEPMRLPDATLYGGTYIFRMLDRSLIQVTSTDRAFVFTTFFTSPVQRADDSERYQLTLLRRGKTPPLVTTLFLGGRGGFEPLYSDEVRGAR